MTNEPTIQDCFEMGYSDGFCRREYGWTINLGMLDESRRAAYSGGYNAGKKDFREERI